MDDMPGLRALNPISSNITRPEKQDLLRNAVVSSFYAAIWRRTGRSMWSA